MAETKGERFVQRKKCLICDGTYRDVQLGGMADYQNYGMGLTLVGSGFNWKAMECSKCHNVQVFRPPNRVG